MQDRIYNFSAGPAILPEDVLRLARESLLSYGDTGIGMMELSHRSPAFKLIIETAVYDLKDLLGIQESHSVLFLQGGASLQFHMVPLNFQGTRPPAYINTGSWSKKAIAEARFFGDVEIIATSEGDQFNRIPDLSGISLDPNTPYLHFTSNNTIFGTQFRTEPRIGDIPLVCDASSDILSRPLNMQPYGLLYAGAQKNLGPAGVTVVIVRNDFLAKSKTGLPPLLSYLNHAKSESLYNTPPTFAIFTVGLVLKWIKQQGGLTGIQQLNETKAELLYATLDQSDFYQGTALKNSRSLMNVTFRLPSPDLEAAFIQQAEKKGLSGLKGHRSVQGIRASIYNAFPIQGVEYLVRFMKEFEQANG